MKLILQFGLMFSLSALTASHATTPLNAQSPLNQQLGYSYGYVMGRSNADTLKKLDMARFMQGLTDGLAEKNAQLSDEQMALLLSQFKKSIEAKELIELQQEAMANAVSGKNFLQRNSKLPNVQSTASGLEYQVLQVGTGKSPSASSSVKILYEGRLIDDTVFDSAIARDQAVELDLKQSILGLVEGLQTMKEGGKTRFFIPANLAYGEMGSGDRVPPNSTVIFDVELIQVLPKKP